MTATRDGGAPYVPQPAIQPASPHKVRDLAALLPCIVYQATLPAFDTTFVGSAVTDELGFAPGELLGATWAQHIHEDDRERVERELAEAVASGRGYQIRYRFWNKARNRIMWFEDRGTIQTSTCGIAQQVHGVMLNITELHSVLEAMQASEARYRLIFDSNPVPLWVFDLETLGFLTVNEAAVRHYGYTREEFARLTLLDIRPAEDSGRLRAEVARRPPGHKDAGVWRHKKKDGTLITVRIMSHGLTFGGRAAEIVLATDITEPLANAQRAREAEARLHKALLQTIEVLVAATEQRDAYTAGHQRGVADLVVAIGRRMQLPELQIEGLRLGALVHDIGKIAVPAELLTLPRALTPVERQLMRQHAVVGYDLLKDVELPWGIARAVHEHHERLDGSGYPDGLKGDAICLEARIIAVADTVEAMASHRPYRPSLGLPVAIQEIVEGRGSRYDALVVDACAAVVAEGFEFI